ncbi:hypothetical protein CMQ_1008 [Grosmannia clavigera kw1407]|uniref:Uncharacterized protein n=1 Tax=Grosmannia clavigera (strain kw1407 / UAMH 11150) TaxID=655863 RepID=F0XCR0_GROCL|nr:uncharacterized protein CMQ_1008 [Grosmannia clavigera kw1407]EFX04080.1 hypothetical protein CMQ_1008 [Grosmannia clavigera kw1407]
MPPANLVTRIKVQLKLSIARLRMVQHRDEALSKASRRAMAQLLEAGKEDSARIRVENIIRSDISTELHEMLELYCELLLARAGLLESPVCDPGLEEAVKSLMYAAPKTEIKELHQVRVLLAERYGKDFLVAAMDNVGGKVSPKVVRKLSVVPPRDELVQGYLEEIAKAYGVRWPRSRADDDDDALLEPPPEALALDLVDLDNIDKDDDDKTDGDHPLAASSVAPATPSRPRPSAKEAREQLDLTRATPPKTAVGSLPAVLPLHVNPPSPSTDNIHPRVTLDSQELKPGTSSPRITAADPAARRLVVKKKDTVDDELARRFASLKRFAVFGPFRERVVSRLQLQTLVHVRQPKGAGPRAESEHLTMEEGYNGTAIILSRVTNGRPESIRLTRHRTGDLAYYRFQDDRRVARSSIVRQYFDFALDWSAKKPQRDRDDHDRETFSKAENNEAEARDSLSVLCISADEERTAAPRKKKSRRRLRKKVAKALGNLQNMSASQLFYEDVHRDGFMSQEEGETRSLPAWQTNGSDDDDFHYQPQNND